MCLIGVELSILLGFCIRHIVHLSTQECLSTEDIVWGNFKQIILVAFPYIIVRILELLSLSSYRPCTNVEGFIWSLVLSLNILEVAVFCIMTRDWVDAIFISLASLLSPLIVCNSTWYIAFTHRSGWVHSRGLLSILQVSVRYIWDTVHFPVMNESSHSFGS